MNLPKYVDINGVTYEQLDFLEEDNMEKMVLYRYMPNYITGYPELKLEYTTLSEVVNFLLENAWVDLNIPHSLSYQNNCLIAQFKDAHYVVANGKKEDFIKINISPFKEK